MWPLKVISTTGQYFYQVFKSNSVSIWIEIRQSFWTESAMVSHVLRKCLWALAIMVFAVHWNILLAGDQVVIPPGWIASQFAGGENIYSTSLAVLDNDELAVFSNDCDILIVSSKDGSLIKKIAGLDKPFAPDTELKREGNLLFAISATESDFMMGVYELDSNTWKGSVSGIRSFNLSRDPSVGLYQNEIRIISENCQIFRWSAEDLSPLPTFEPPAELNLGNNRRITPIGTGIDNGYCAGITEAGNSLVFESDGVWTIRSVPGISQIYKSAPYSESFLLFDAQDNAGKRGQVIWKKGSPKSAPEFVVGLNVNQIWNRKYALTKNQPVLGSRALSVLDLERPHDLPIVLPIDTEFLGFLGFSFIGITEDYFWITVRPQKTFYRFPLRFSDQPVSVKVSNANAPERDGALLFKVSVDTQRELLKPVKVRLRTRSGSAQEDDDYVNWEGSVVLSTRSQTADVKIAVKRLS